MICMQIIHPEGQVPLYLGPLMRIFAEADKISSLASSYMQWFKEGDRDSQGFEVN